MGAEFKRAPPHPNHYDRGGIKNNTTTQDALEYLTKVKKAFEGSPDLYARFLEIMKDFKSSKIRVHEVKEKVVNLFYGNDDLLLGFNMFLPEEHTIRVPVPKPVQPLVHPPVQFEEAMSFVNKIKSRFVDEPNVFSSFLKILNLYKTNHKSCQEIYQEVEPLFKGHQDLLNGFRRFLPMTHQNFASCQAGSIIRDDWSLAMASFKNPQPVKNEKTSKDSEESGHSECEVRESHPDTKKMLWEHGSQSTPDPMSDEDNKEAIKDVTILKFFKRVKERLEPDAYQDFLKCVDLSRVGAFTKESLEILASGLFADYPDLVHGFKEIIVAHGGKADAGSLNGEDEEEREREGKREKERERQERRTRSPPLLAKEKFSLCKPVSELDLSDCKQCTPSYRLLPNHYPVPPATQRTELGKSVLNDTWVSVTSGSEDYSFKHMRKNQYEESLFRCEDDRFELDMLVESVKSAIKRVEKFMKKMNEGSIDLSEAINIDDYLTPMNVRCIEKLYGDHGLDAMEVLRRKPEAALPVLLFRLKQKLEEWDQCRADLNVLWADVYAKNYHKSLDHRSFYFKQQDIKNLSSKALQAEIKEIHEKNLGDGSCRLAIGAETGMSASHDMQFDFIDSDLHEDLYQVIKYSCDELFSPDQSRQAMHVWAFFLEPFLGVASRHQESSEVTREQQVRSKSSGGKKACIMHVGESAGSAVAVVELSGSAAAPGATDTAGPTSGAQNNTGVNGTLRKSSVTMEAVAKRLSDNKTSAPTKGGEKRSCRSTSPKVKREEREEGEISPEPRDSDEENSLSSGAAENGVKRGRDEASGSSEEGEMIDHQEKMESEGEEAYTWEMTNLPSSHGFNATARPVAKYWKGTYVEKEKRVFYGDGHFYVLFRLHQILYERMLSAKNNSMDEEKRWRACKGSNPPDLYSRFKRALYNLLDGSSENVKFEDECRATSGTQSYVLFTLDKLIFKIVKQLQVVASDETSNKLYQLYNYEKSRRHDRKIDYVYYENARALVHNEAIYQLESGSNPTRLVIQLMDLVHANSEQSVSVNPDFRGYLFKDYLTNVPEEDMEGVYLKRCKRKLDSSDGEALDGIKENNGLECKLLCATSKVVYVLHTEDFMYRKCKRRRHSEKVMS